MRVTASRSDSEHQRIRAARRAVVVDEHHRSESRLQPVRFVGLSAELG
jgi:hypothetical protein